jgi:hypothetical protein
MKPSADVEKYIRATYDNAEELLSEPSKKHAAVVTTPAKIREIFAVIKSENPTFDSSSQKNVEKIIDWLWENDAVGGFALDNVRTAYAALSYPEDRLERVAPPAPPEPAASTRVQPPPVDYNSFSDTDELPIDTPSWRLQKATRSQLRSVVKRQAEAKKEVSK